jgi:hypothetical protein
MSNDAAPLEVDTRYRDSALPVDERVEILLSQMTLAEKAGPFFQMISMGPGITTGCALRHRVDTVDPLFRFGHGLTL